MSFTPVLRTTSSVLKNLKPLSRVSPQGLLQKPNTRSYHMSLVPYLMRDLLQELERPRLYDQYFGMPLSPAMIDPGYLRPWRLLDQLESGVAIEDNKDNFKVSLDVQQFKPEELSVKVVDNFVVVEGKHEERRDNHGFVSRQFTRRYRLPDDVDTSALQTTLSSDGVLQLHAPKKLQEKNARHVPITQTNTPAVKAGESGQQEQKKLEEKKK